MGFVYLGGGGNIFSTTQTMNTVRKGDNFEIKSYGLIKNAIDEDKFGISPKYSKVFLKKGYYSNLRKKEIIFDLSIEIWPPDAERYSILYLIECKDYASKKVPVDDIEEFLFKVQQIANHGHYIKAAFIANNSFQEGALEIAKNAGLMLLEVIEGNKLSIKLHRTNRINEVDILEKEIETFLLSVFDLNKVEGLVRYSRKDIMTLTENLLNEIDDTILKFSFRTPIDKLIHYLEEKHNVVFDFDNTISELKDILGYFDITENKIRIDESIKNTERFAFLLAHEIGHFFLHKNLKINQIAYNNFKDSQYDFLSNKYQLNNHKNWIEWQANEFASNLILPNSSFYNRLVHIQAQLGISRRGHIYLDDQPINRKDFGDITTYLSRFFNTTYTSVIMKLESMNLIIYNRKVDSYKNELRNILLDEGF